MGRPAVFLDRDGVLCELVPDPLSGTPESPYAPEDVALVPGAAAAVRSLRDAGFATVVASNQPAAAKGRLTCAELRAVHDRVLALLAAEDAAPDAWRYCPHHPDGTVPELAGPCACRKPGDGLLREAAADLGLDLAASWMVGDSDTDVAAGQAAGCRTVLLAHPGSAHRRAGAARPTFTAPDLAVAVGRIVR